MKGCGPSDVNIFSTPKNYTLYYIFSFHFNYCLVNKTFSILVSRFCLKLP